MSQGEKERRDALCVSQLLLSHMFLSISFN